MTRTRPERLPQRALAWIVAVSVLALSTAALATTGGDPRPEGDDDEKPAEVAPGKPAPAKPAPAKPEKVEEPAPDPLADVKAVVRAAFKACHDSSESVGFDRYIDLIHAGQKDAGHSVEMIRRYSWAKFRGGCYQWLTDRKGLDFVIARTDPAEVTKDTEVLKLFFKAQHKPDGGGPLRWDAPMEFHKDGTRWFIWRNSL